MVSGRDLGVLKRPTTANRQERAQHERGALLVLPQTARNSTRLLACVGILEPVEADQDDRG